MIYHLETIPVWEAMEAETACPFCMLYQKLEQNEVERSLGGSVMEPDARIRVNETGICAHHHTLLFGMQNRLGHALLCDSHSKEILMKLHQYETAHQSYREAVRRDPENRKFREGALDAAIAMKKNRPLGEKLRDLFRK